MTIDLGNQILMWGLTAGVLLLAVVVLLLTRQVNRLTRGSGGYTQEPGKSNVDGDLEVMRSRLERLATDVASVRADGEGALRRLGVVRYDAFRDMGGHMSFSVVLLDARRNGLVISILNGRDGSRGYAKAVRDGKSSSPLSDEEQEALAQALDLARVQ